MTVDAVITTFPGRFVRLPIFSSQLENIFRKKTPLAKKNPKKRRIRWDPALFWVDVKANLALQ
jgi:hypothetical protein